MVDIKGKHLQTLRAYVEALRFDDTSTHLDDFGPFLAVRDLIVSVHAGRIDADTAYRMILSAYYRFATSNISQSFIRPPSEVQQELSAMSESLVEALKSEIESYPNSYLIRIELPNFEELGPFRIQLADRIALVGGTDHGFESAKVGFDFGDELLQQGIGALLANKQAPQFATYLEIAADGYTDAGLESTLASTAISSAKQAVVMLRGASIVRRAHRSHQSRVCMYDTSNGVKRAVQAPSAFEKIFGEIALDRSKLHVREKVTQGLFTDFSKPLRLAKTPKEVVDSLEAMVGSIRRFFTLAQTEEARSIGAAMEWFMDAEVGENETLAFLSCCIGLEALLGDHSAKGGDNVSGDRLADRYAFLLGRTHEARRELRSEYKQVLDARGDLVHGRAARIPEKHKPKLRIARQMLWRVVWHEFQSLMRNYPASGTEQPLPDPSPH